MPQPAWTKALACQLMLITVWAFATGALAPRSLPAQETLPGQETLLGQETLPAKQILPAENAMPDVATQTGQAAEHQPAPSAAPSTSQSTATAAEPTELKIDVKNDGRYNSVVYVQNAAEFRLACEQAYQLAAMRLHSGLQDVRWTADEVQVVAGDFESLPPAVILDVDETVLDNSPFNARNIIDGETFSPPTWNDWCNEAKATAIPGALAFIRMAKRMGVEVFYITNRRDEVKAATLENLLQLGFPVSDETLMTQNSKDNRDGRKTTRRATVAKDFRIVLLIGDNLSDMCTGVEVRDTIERNAVAQTKGNELSSRWILIPNPVYGAWERASPQGAEALRTER